MLRRKDLPNCSHSHLQRRPFLSSFLHAGLFFFFFPNKGADQKLARDQSRLGQNKHFKRDLCFGFMSPSSSLWRQPFGEAAHRCVLFFCSAFWEARRRGRWDTGDIQRSLAKFVRCNGSNRSLCTEFPLGLSSPALGLAYRFIVYWLQVKVNKWSYYLS